MSNGGTPAVEIKETGRVEAFSDGVFAVAITLLALDLRVPHDMPDGRSLAHALLAQWPGYLAFVTSFATIGIMWINHHRLFTHIRRTDNTLLVLNGLLLLGVTFVPFPTAVVAEYIPRPAGQAAAVLFSGTYAVLAVLFNLLWRYSAGKNRLLDRRADPRVVEAITRGYSVGPPLYFLSFALAFVNVAASIVMNLLLAIFFALPNQNPLIRQKAR